ncbi:MAG: septation protein A [Pseudomonadota bacterium]
MQNMLIDFIPVLLFFVAFKMYGIYVATTVGIVATAVQVVFTRLTRKKFDKQQLVTLAVFVVFGGMTLYFHNPIFIKWKPTIVFWVFGIAFLLSQFIGDKPIVQRMLEKVLEGNASLPEKVWTRLNYAWAAFFIVLGSVNLFVAYNFDTDVWVNFKVYGIMGILIIFSFVQALFLSRFLADGKR